MLKRIVIAGLLATLTAVGAPRLTAAADGPRWGGGYVPNVAVVDQNGAKIWFYEDAIRHKIVVLSFIYTSCSNICPLVVSRLSQLQHSLSDVLGTSVFFVSVSIDPINDTPEKLAAFAAGFRADPSWLFLTGAFADINAIRYKLGERTKALTEHRNDILLFNDRTGDWQRASAFDDIELLALSVRSMDPTWRMRMGAAVGEPDETVASGAAASGHVEGKSLFVKLCSSCHTIGAGERIGPDLSGLFERRTRDWIAAYVAEPAALRARDDPTAIKLAQSYPSVQMPSLGLSNADIEDLVYFIESIDSK